LPLHELHRQVTAVVEVADLVDGHDVRVVERRGRPRLLLEAARDVRMIGETWPQHLHRDLASEAVVVGQVDLSHAAAAEQADHVVGADRPADPLAVLLDGQLAGGIGQRRVFHEAGGFVVGGQERLHLFTDGGPVAARRLEPRAPLRSGHLQGCVIQPFDLSILLGSHVRRLSSRYNQALARLQSRLTVATETSSTRAASSRLSPPK
jgi:hypothetical protein